MESESSNICQYGNKGFPNCHCNICIEKITEYYGFKKNEYIVIKIE